MVYDIVAIGCIVTILTLMVTTEYIAQDEFYNPPDDDYDELSTYLPINVISIYGVYGTFVIVLRMGYFQRNVVMKRLSCACYNPSVDLFTQDNPYLVKDKVWCLLPYFCILMMVAFGSMVSIVRPLFVTSADDGQVTAAEDAEGGYLGWSFISIILYVGTLILLSLPLLLIMACVVDRQIRIDQHQPTSLVEKQAIAMKVYNQHLTYVFLLITIHYYIIATNDRRELFQYGDSGNIRVENVIYLVCYIVITVSIVVLKYSPNHYEHADSEATSNDFRITKDNDDDIHELSEYQQHITTNDDNASSELQPSKPSSASSLSTSAPVTGSNDTPLLVV